MKTAVLATLAMLTISGAALADDIASFDATAGISGLDPAVDQTHTVSVRIYTDAAGTPAAEILVDGAPVLP